MMRIAFKTCMLAAALLLTKNNFAQNDYRSLPMWDTNLSFEQRVNDVVSRLTLEEKVKQMLNATPVSYQNINSKIPLKALKGFQRVSLKAGESKSIILKIIPEQLSVVDEAGNLYQAKEKLMTSVGVGQPGVKNKTTSNVISKIISIQ